MAEQLWHAQMLLEPDIPALDALFQQLMLSNGDYIHYRESQVLEYAQLACELDPTLLVAWHLAGWVLAEQHAAPQLQQDIERVLDHQWPFFAPPPLAHKPVAEGHVHLGGVTLDGLVLTDHILGQAMRWPDRDAPALRQGARGCWRYCWGK